MIDKVSFRRIRADRERFDKSRELVIKESRDILKSSKAAIYALHRNDSKRADTLLKAAKQKITKLKSIIKKDPELLLVGAYNDALEEYCEAFCYSFFIKKGCIPSPEQVGVSSNAYLGGLCDLVGELVRRAINDLIRGNEETALASRDLVSSLYAELMLFDWRNTPIRRKFDSIKYGLEKLDDVVLQLKLRR